MQTLEDLFDYLNKPRDEKKEENYKNNKKTTNVESLSNDSIITKEYKKTQIQSEQLNVNKYISPDCTEIKKKEPEYSDTSSSSSDSINYNNIKKNSQFSLKTDKIKAKNQLFMNPILHAQMTEVSKSINSRLHLFGYNDNITLASPTIKNIVEIGVVFAKILSDDKEKEPIDERLRDDLNTLKKKVKSLENDIATLKKNLNYQETENKRLLNIMRAEKLSIRKLKTSLANKTIQAINYTNVKKPIELCNDNFIRYTIQRNSTELQNEIEVILNKIRVNSGMDQYGDDLMNNNINLSNSYSSVNNSTNNNNNFLSKSEIIYPPAKSENNNKNLNQERENLATSCSVLQFGKFTTKAKQNSLTNSIVNKENTNLSNSYNNNDIVNNNKPQNIYIDYLKKEKNIKNNNEDIISPLEKLKFSKTFLFEQLDNSTTFLQSLTNNETTNLTQQQQKKDLFSDYKKQENFIDENKDRDSDLDIGELDTLQQTGTEEATEYINNQYEKIKKEKQKLLDEKRYIKCDAIMVAKSKNRITKILKKLLQDNEIFNYNSSAKILSIKTKLQESLQEILNIKK